MKALYALSGDPPTNGHEWMIREASKLADILHVALAANSEKNYMFSENQRGIMLRSIMDQYNTGHIHLHIIHKELLVAYARTLGCTHLIRGVRNVKDYEYERTMAAFNKKFEPSITTIFLFPPPEVQDISSSFVKSLIGIENWHELVSDYVNPFVLSKLKEVNHD